MSLVNWLFLDLNSFFASCEQQDNPALRGRPVAIVPSLTDTTSVIAASYECKRRGVKTGTRVREAKELIPDIVLLTGNHRRYVQYHNMVMAAAETVLPVERVCSVDEFACRLMGDEREPREAIAMAMCVKNAIARDVGEAITCSIGLAPNTMLAKMAADMQKPDGLTLLRPEDIPGKMLHLPMQDIPGIGPRMGQRLVNMGITSMTQLYAADMHLLRAAWGGIEGERFYHKLRGEEPYYAATRTRCMSHQHVLEPAFRSHEGVRSYAQHLTLKVAERLRQKKFLARHMSLSIRWAGDFSRSYEETTFHESCDSLNLMRILNERLLAPALAANKRKKPFKVSVTIDDFIPAAAHQLDMFVEEQKSELSNALDKINTRYGRGTLFFGGTEALQKHLHARIAFSRVPGEEEFEERLRRSAAIQTRQHGDA